MARARLPPRARADPGGERAERATRCLADLARHALCDVVVQRQRAGRVSFSAALRMPRASAGSLNGSNASARRASARVPRRSGLRRLLLARSNEQCGRGPVECARVDLPSILECRGVVDVESLEELTAEQLQRAELSFGAQRLELPCIDVELGGVQLQRVAVR